MPICFSIPLTKTVNSMGEEITSITDIKVHVKAAATAKLFQPCPTLCDP